MLADELKTTKLLSVKKFYSNHGKHNKKKVLCKRSSFCDDFKTVDEMMSSLKYAFRLHL